MSCKRWAKIRDSNTLLAWFSDMYLILAERFDCWIAGCHEAMNIDEQDDDLSDALVDWDSIEMSFSDALEELKSGGKVARQPWRDTESNVYLFLCRDRIMFHTSDGNKVGWWGSSEDILATDWMLISE